jgi:amino acid transporter
MNAPKIVEQGAASDAPRAPKLARRLGLFDATMIVMGGIIGSGIFINPYVVARQVHTPFMILGAWLLGGLIALAGAFIYAELAARRPHVGGQYAYLREAYHPSVAFIYGWALLLVTQTGGMAAVAVTFSRYFLEITRAPVADWLIAVIALGLLTIVNCLGVRAGSSMQIFKSVAWLDPRTRVPVLAIALQGLLAVIIALSGKYEQILNYVVSVDFIWFGLTAASIFVFRHRARGVKDESKASGYNVPGHPLTTALFVLACALIVISTINKYPANSAIGLVIVVAGIPVYFFWRWWRRHE